MQQVFNIIRPDGRIARQSSSRECAEREICWWAASGATDLRIEPIERSGEGRFGYGRPARSGGVWPSAKVEEFRERYARGEAVNFLAEHFDCSIANVCKRARSMGFGHRIDDSRNFEKHMGRWTDREERLINFMYDEGMPVREIAGHINRGQSAIEERLRNTASDLSNRSKFGRFIARPGTGKRAISAALEGEYSDDG